MQGPPHTSRRLPKEGDVQSQQTTKRDKVNKVINHFALLNQYDHLNNMGMEGEDISQKTMQ